MTRPLFENESYEYDRRNFFVDVLLTSVTKCNKTVSFPYLKAGEARSSKLYKLEYQE